MLNKVILIGRLTANPELKQTASGISVVSFSVAVDRRFSGKDTERKADFINVVAWRHSADFVAKYFGKGDPIGIEGSIQTRSYEDKTGAKRVAVEVLAENTFFVGGKNSGGNGGNSGGYQPTAQQAPAPVAFENGGVNDFMEVDVDDDLPF